jgi:type VI secretion system protein ImpM
VLDAVEALPEPEFRPLPQYRSVQALAGSARACVVAADEKASRADSVLGLVEKSYGRLLGPHSLWWTKGSQCVDPCLLISSGLPEAGQLAAMFDGEWSRWGWASEQIVKPEEPAEALG